MQIWPNNISFLSINKLREIFEGGHAISVKKKINQLLIVFKADLLFFKNEMEEEWQLLSKVSAYLTT